VRYNSRGDLGLLRFTPPEIVNCIEIIAGDLRDSSAVDKALTGCNIVFHLGAMISIPYSYVHPREVVETNVIGTMNVLEAARRQKTDRVIHTSSSEVYGTAQTSSIKENHPLQGQSPYSASKIAADKLAESYFKAFGVPIVTIRPFNTYGPRQSARAIIPTIISQALVCNEIKLGSLTPSRDFTFVKDTVAGIMLAGMTEKALGMEINFGNDHEVTIGELAEIIIKMIGKHVPITSEDNRRRPEKSEVQRLHADYSRAKDLLGWQPKVKLSVGLLETIKWIKNNHELYRPNVYAI
jgi:dTDP-glucose 4,6-dehydratase